MHNGHRLTFEEIFKQNEYRIHYHIKKLGIQDPHREFYVEGLYALWIAYKKYQPDKGPLSTYFNFYIRNHFIDTLRKNARQQQIIEKLTMEKSKTDHHGNRYGDTKLPIIDTTDIVVNDYNYWKNVFERLTVKQRKWLFYHVLLDMQLKELAEREGTTVEAVKSWGKEAKKKLKRARVVALS